MPEVILNDEQLQAEPGEQLLALARRKGAHMWFACDGRGFCRTCECRVLAGSESLNPPSSIEQEALSEERRKDGYRLACQTTLCGNGPVEVLSQAEWLRRKALGVVLPDSPGQIFDNLGLLSGGMLSAAKAFGRALPAVLLSIVPAILDDPPTLESSRKYLEDAARMVQHLLDKPAQK